MNINKKTAKNSRWPDSAYETTPAHLIRQKKDFSCLQSGGDDSEMEKEMF